MPPRPNRTKKNTKAENGDPTQPALFIDIQLHGDIYYHCYLVNAVGDTWRIAGPKGYAAILETATKFAEFSGLRLYMEGKRFDGLKPTLMKGNAS